MSTSNRRSEPIAHRPESTYWINHEYFIYYVAESHPSPTGYDVFDKNSRRKICNTRLLYPHDTPDQIIAAADAALQDLERQPGGKDLLERLTWLAW